MAYNKPRCDCPDATAARQRDPGADYISRQIGLDWSAGFDGVRARGGYCIHEMAVIRFRKETDLAFPSGLPTDARTPPSVKLGVSEPKFKEPFND